MLHDGLRSCTQGGTSYVWINPTPGTGHAPPNATYWAVLAAKGDVGAAGPQGVPGPVGPGGDMSGSNNLSEINNTKIAAANLKLTKTFVAGDANHTIAADERVVRTSQIFYGEHAVIDRTTSRGIYLDDNLPNSQSFSLKGWVASATGSGLCVVHWTGNLVIDGYLYANASSGLLIVNSATYFYVKFSKSAALDYNGRYGGEPQVAGLFIDSDCKPVFNAIGAYGPNYLSTLVEFSAHKNGTSQTGINTTATKVTFSTEQYDVGSCYDTANSRWTPPAGPVTLKAGLVYDANVSVGSYAIVSIYKNGSALKAGTLFWAFTAGYMSGGIAVDDVADGTDYYEVFTNGGTSSNFSVNGAPSNTWFMGTAR